MTRSAKKRSQGCLADCSSGRIRRANRRWMMTSKSPCNPQGNLRSELHPCQRRPWSQFLQRHGLLPSKVYKERAARSYKSNPRPDILPPRRMRRETLQWRPPETRLEVPKINQFDKLPHPTPKRLGEPWYPLPASRVHSRRNLLPPRSLSNPYHLLSSDHPAKPK